MLHGKLTNLSVNCQSSFNERHMLSTGIQPSMKQPSSSVSHRDSVILEFLFMKCLHHFPFPAHLISSDDQRLQPWLKLSSESLFFFHLQSEHFQPHLENNFPGRPPSQCKKKTNVALFTAPTIHLPVCVSCPGRRGVGGECGHTAARWRTAE